MTPIRRAAVLGAGVMGAQIAAHFANAGVPVLLLDLTDAQARDGLDRAARLSPDPFFTAGTRALVQTAGFDDGLERAGECDWILEAVVEQAEAKRALLTRLEPIHRDGAIVSSNTSGIPLGELARGFGDRLRRSFLGTHFFNPPRYLRLLELIPTPDTDPGVLERVRAFAEARLGKGVVVARDVPGFIANRLALYGVARALDAVARGRITIAEADALTGPLLGRPKSATFRTMDVAGIDILARVAADLRARLEGEEGAAFALPPFVNEMVRRGWIGAKAGQGFYRKSEDGTILALDPATMTYAAPEPVRIPSIDAVRGVEPAAVRIRRLFLAGDRGGEFLRDTIGHQLLCAARSALEIAGSIDDVDRALRWGFGWELGPFETWDAIGIDEVLTATGEADPPALVAEARSRGAFRPAGSAAGGGAADRVFVPVPPSSPAAGVLDAARRRPPVRGNAAASVVDLGEDVLGLVLHSKMNVIGHDTMAMLEAAVQEAESRGRPLVVCTGGPQFSAGANLMLVLIEAQDGNWEEIDLMVRAFQRATLRLRTAAVPVVAAPLGLTLGGGCELCLHADRVEAAAETYIGLVETGVGLIPAGGGTKEMLARAMDSLPPGADLQPAARRVFETLALAKLSGSAAHARELGYLRPADGVTMNVDHLVARARQVALERAAGYVPAPPRPAIRVGGESLEAALALGVHLAWRAGRISDHDALIARRLAHVLAGGTLRHEGVLSEQQLLDLEREAFLGLCGEPKTLARIAHTLKTGKPLRN
jgi:3-hydroxyacyl-CoA dehydrogenase